MIKIISARCKGNVLLARRPLKDELPCLHLFYMRRGCCEVKPWVGDSCCSQDGFHIVLALGVASHGQTCWQRLHQLLAFPKMPSKKLLPNLRCFLRAPGVSGAHELKRNRKPEASEPFFQEPRAEPEPLGLSARNRNWNWNRPSPLSYAEGQTKPFPRGTAGSENWNHSNRSTPKQ